MENKGEINVSNLQDNKLTIEQLLGAVKQLSPAELREFTRQFFAWQSLLQFIGEQKGEQVAQSEIFNQRLDAEEEAALLACISENSRLPATEQRRYERLRRKCEARTLTESELAEYQLLLQQLEAHNVKRIKALIALAQRHGTTLRGIMAKLGLKGVDDAF